MKIEIIFSNDTDVSDIAALMYSINRVSDNTIKDIRLVANRNESSKVNRIFHLIDDIVYRRGK